MTSNALPILRHLRATKRKREYYELLADSAKVADSNIGIMAQGLADQLNEGGAQTSNMKTSQADALMIIQAIAWQVIEADGN